MGVGVVPKLGSNPLFAGDPHAKKIIVLGSKNIARPSVSRDCAARPIFFNASTTVLPRPTSTSTLAA